MWLLVPARTSAHLRAVGCARRTQILEKQLGMRQLQALLAAIVSRGVPGGALR
jgi:hypothetical protein